jgi:tetratricopeptide (TPR) repeat protein
MRPTLRRSWIAFAGALVLMASGVAHAAVDLEQSLASLRELAARHPNDPDYSWAVANALEATGRDSEAAQHMRAHLKRWPERPRSGWRSLGRCEYRAARFGPARDALQTAVARDPRDVEARLYLGLALRALGERHRAEEQLEMVAELDPELAADALLLAGISHLQNGDEREGRALLDRVVALSPNSDSAREARALAQRDESGPSSLRLEGFTSFQYDSNATQEGGSDQPGAGSADPDFFSGVGARLTWRPTLLGESRPLELTALYDRYDYVELTEFSQQRALGGGAWTQPLGKRAALRLAGNGAIYLLDDTLNLVRGQLLPTLFLDLGGRRGVLRMYGVGEMLEYDEDVPLDSLDRSGWEYGGGAEHQWFFGGEHPRGFFAWGGRFDRHAGSNDRDLLGFANAYDRDRWRASTRAQLDLPFDISAYADFFVDTERYHHRNVVDAVSEEPTSPDKRRDLVLTSSLSLRRKLVGPFDLELIAGYEDRDSNVDLYAYRRATGGIRLHAMLP